MAGKDIIASLKVEGQVEFINSMNQSAQSVENLDTTISETAKELSVLTDQLRDSVKSGKGITDAMNKLDNALDSASHTIVKMSSTTNEAYKNTAKLETAYNDLRKETIATAKSVDNLGTAFNDTTKDIKSFDKAVELTDDELYNLGANFEDIYGTLKPLTGRLGEMEDRMYELALAGKQNTDEFRALNAEAIRFRKTQIEVDKAIDSLADSGAGIRAVSEGISGIAGAFAVGQGAIALFGEENEALEKTLIKLNAVMAISSGIQQVNENLLQKNAFTTKAMAVAQSAYSLAVGTSTGALKVFRLALIATGIGALVVVLGTIIANWDKLSAAIVNSVPGIRKFGEAWTSVKDNVLAFFRSFTTILLEAGKIVFSFGKNLAMALAEPWNAVDLAKNFMRDVGNGIDNINGKFREQKTLVVANRLEQERIAKVQKQIEAAELAILKARAGNASEARIQSLELQKARLELSLLQSGSKEYYEKQIEINGILKSNTKELKEQNNELVAQIGSLAQLQDEYNKQIEIANKSVEGSDRYNTALAKAAELSGIIGDKQDAINSKLNEAKTIAEDWASVFESIANIPEEKFELDISDFAEVMQMNIENEERLREAQGLTFDERRKQLDDLEAIEIGRAQNIGAETADIEEYYRLQRIKLDKEESDLKIANIQKERDERIAAAQQTLSQTQQIGSMAFGIFQQFNDAQRQVLENRLKAGLISEEQYNREVAKLNEKQAKADKLKALFDASINGAVAVISALPNIPLSVIIGALVAAQIAAIAATPIPKFFKGVIGLKRGNNPKGRDTIPAMLNEGESVMTTQETQQHRPVLEAIRNKTFDQMYIRRGKLEQRTLSSIVNFSGSKRNKRLEKKLDMINAELQNINSNTHIGANSSSQMNKLMRKQNRRNGKHFV